MEFSWHSFYIFQLSCTALHRQGIETRWGGDPRIGMLAKTLRAVESLTHSSILNHFETSKPNATFCGQFLKAHYKRFEGILCPVKEIELKLKGLKWKGMQSPESCCIKLWPQICAALSFVHMIINLT